MRETKKINKLQKRLNELDEKLLNAMKSNDHNLVLELHNKITSVEEDINYYQTELNKKIAKWCGIFVLIGILLVTIIIYFSSNTDDTSKSDQETQAQKNKINALVGTIITPEQHQKWGLYEIIQGLDMNSDLPNNYLMVYYSKPNLSLVELKGYNFVIGGFFGHNKDKLINIVENYNNSLETNGGTLCKLVFEDLAKYKGSALEGRPIRMLTEKGNFKLTMEGALVNQYGTKQNIKVGCIVDPLVGIKKDGYYNKAYFKKFIPQ